MMTIIIRSVFEENGKPSKLKKCYLEATYKNSRIW